MLILKLYHLEDDLHISDKQYLLCLMILYFSYAFFEVCLAPRGSSSQSEHVLTGPKQFSSKKTASQRLAVSAYTMLGYYSGYSCPLWLGTLLNFFQTTQGLVKNYGQLLGESPRTFVITFVTRPPGVRWLLGVFEAGLFPGGNYYLSWYDAVTISSSISSPLLAGTNVRSSASGRQFSSRRPRYQVHSVVCLLYVKHLASGEFPLTPSS